MSARTVAVAARGLAGVSDETASLGWVRTALGCAQQ